VTGLAVHGRSSSGSLYAPVSMADGEVPRVLDSKPLRRARDAQVLLLRLEDALLPILAAVASGHFDAALNFRHGMLPACIGLASPVLPRPARSRRVDRRAPPRLGAWPGVQIFHAGTALLGDELVSAGCPRLTSAPSLRKQIKERKWDRDG